MSSQRNSEKVVPVGSDDMRNWRIAGVAALGVIVLSIPLYVAREIQRNGAVNSIDVPAATFVGRENCVDCHTDAYEKWLGSDHDNAMDIANEQTVLGDFDNAEFEHGGVTSRFYKNGDEYFVFTDI